MIKDYKNDPSVTPQTELVCKPIRRIMEEKSMTRHHGGKIIGRGIIERESLRMEALGGIWDLRRPWAPGGSKPQKSTPLLARTQKLH